MGLVPSIAQGLHISVPDAGNVITSYALGVFLGAPVIATLGTNVERRRMLVGLMSVYALGNLMSALANGYMTLLISRFIAGLPHGAYFGFAAILATGAAPPERRARAVASVVLGLTVATIAGVPLVTALSQIASWRSAFIAIAFLSILSALAIRLVAPCSEKGSVGGTIRSEFRVMRFRQMWLTLAIGATGFGGIFCVYTYLATIMDTVAHTPAWSRPFAFAVFGAGMTLGTIGCSRAADCNAMRAIGVTLTLNIVALLAFDWMCREPITLFLAIFFVGAGGGLAAIVQARLLEISHEGQGLASALNQSAFNVANALGPLAGGMAIRFGLPWQALGSVAALFPLLGLLFWGLTMLDLKNAHSRVFLR
ncbi:MAG: MFS transporter [Acetobacter sp.]|nr:MFS transporter [Acetobacter sp.]MCI1412778.1 MFS transporter [Acetobacter sp.]MCI1441412.1 MFS transporter [Acetobacter sp.]MCI1528790.1 MFS transporter [Acetobacter sp.]MCI1586682.1 MFS transporter [Acetobacter sp.]